MDIDPLVGRAREPWETLGGARFPGPGCLAVVHSPGSRVCPPSWVGLVALGQAAIATAPTQRAARRVRRTLHDVPIDGVTDPTSLPAVEVLGPATLAYASTTTFRPTPGRVDRLTPGHPELRRLADEAGPDDAGESGVEEITSPAFVVRERGLVVAAAGYRAWPAATAHLCVLTAPDHRGRGLARRAASAAVAHALADGLLPQWRARPPASRQVARALGFHELGTQLSVRMHSLPTTLDRLAS